MSQDDQDQEPEEGGFVGDIEPFSIGSEEDPRKKEVVEAVREAQKHPTRRAHWLRRAAALGREAARQIIDAFYAKDGD